jgi:hypothetical protein
VNIDWPVHAGPDALYEGFGIYNATAVDPLLGTDDEWAAFADEVHRRGMRLVSDFNPSYFWYHRRRLDPLASLPSPRRPHTLESTLTPTLLSYRHPLILSHAECAPVQDGRSSMGAGCR